MSPRRDYTRRVDEICGVLGDLIAESRDQDELEHLKQELEEIMEDVKQRAESHRLAVA